MIETPGGWNDFLTQNPGFFERSEPAGQALKPAPEKTPAPARATKLSYKDQRRLEVLNASMPRLAADIAALEISLHDPDLYGRDRVRFETLTARLATTRAELSAAEDEWLALEELKENLG